MAPHDSPPPPPCHPETGPPSAPLTLREVLNRDDLGEAGDVPFTAATEFSGRVTPGALFAGLRGTDLHGAWFWEEAVERGAALILTDEPLPESPIPVAVVRHGARATFGEVCHVLHGRPSERLFVVGVTGTNGKSTVCWLLRSIFRTSPPQADDSSSRSFPSVPAGLCGTIETDDGRDIVPSTLTTPTTEDLHAWLARCVANGCEAAAVELSSHALDQDRAAGLRLSSAVVTNVTRDHLDYHGDLDAVGAAKAKIVDLLRPGGRLVFGEGETWPAFRHLSQAWRRLAIACGDDFADAVIDRPDCRADGASFRLIPQWPGGGELVDLRTPLLGWFNVSNAAAAAVAADAFPKEKEAVADGLANVAPVPGRLEPIDAGQPFRVLVDYAHTPDGLRAVIDAVRPLCSGSLRLVVGAGGDRDRGKRAAMGAAAGLADRVVFTSDNPRSEDPHAILRDLAAGHPDPGRFDLIENRRDAIRASLAAAAPGDWVLVCGKGHETTQEVAGVFRPFDDRAVCRELLGELGFGG